MARIARVVAAGYPHQVTQRGNRRQEVFFNEEDYLAYKELMREWCDGLSWNSSTTGASFSTQPRRKRFFPEFVSTRIPVGRWAERPS